MWRKLLPKWAAPKALFSDLYSKIETWKLGKVPKSTSQTIAQIDQFFMLYLLYIGILMAIDGKAALAFENFCAWQKFEGFWRLSWMQRYQNCNQNKSPAFIFQLFSKLFRVICKEVEAKDNHKDRWHL